jgi:hypothetical protein
MRCLVCGARTEAQPAPVASADAALATDAATVMKMYAPPLRPSDTLIVMAFDIVSRAAAIRDTAALDVEVLLRALDEYAGSGEWNIEDARRLAERYRAILTETEHAAT